MVKKTIIKKKDPAKVTLNNEKQANVPLPQTDFVFDLQSDSNLVDAAFDSVLIQNTKTDQVAVKSNHQPEKKKISPPSPHQGSQIFDETSFIQTKGGTGEHDSALDSVSFLDEEMDAASEVDETESGLDSLLSELNPPLKEDILANEKPNEAPPETPSPALSGGTMMLSKDDRSFDELDEIDALLSENGNKKETSPSNVQVHQTIML
jgi:hypothetical protein